MKRAFTVLLGIALIASIAWNAQTRHALEAEKAQRANQDEMIQSLVAQVKTLESQVSQTKQQNQSQMRTELSRVADLKARLAAQRDLAYQAKQRLEDARSNARTAGEPSSLQEKLKQEKGYIEEINRKLQQHHQQESQINVQNKATLEQQKWQHSEDHIALEARIRAQESTIQSTIEKLNEAKRRRDFIGKEEFQKLQDELKAEKSTLSQLKEQKQLIDQRWREEQSLTTNQTHLSQQGLKESDEKLRQMIQQEQARYQAMQSELNSSQKDRQSKQDEIKKLEADFQLQNAKANELETALHAEQNTLQRISY